MNRVQRALDRFYFNQRSRFKPADINKKIDRIAELNIAETFIGITPEQEAERDRLRKECQFWIAGGDYIYNAVSRLWYPMGRT